MKAVLQELQPLACCLVLSSNSIWNIIYTFKLLLLSLSSTFLKKYFIPMHVCMSTECVRVLVEVRRGCQTPGVGVTGCYKLHEVGSVNQTWVLWKSCGHSSRSHFCRQPLMGFCKWPCSAFLRTGGSQQLWPPSECPITPSLSLQRKAVDITGYFSQCLMN